MPITIVSVRTVCKLMTGTRPPVARAARRFGEGTTVARRTP